MSGNIHFVEYKICPRAMGKSAKHIQGITEWMVFEKQWNSDVFDQKKI